MDDRTLLSLAARLAEDAARCILDIRQRGFTVRFKPDGSPETDADIASQALILSGLGGATPAIPVIAEEASPISFSAAQFWLVDPLDGTREFAAGFDEFVVNIGLVRNGRVVLGAVAHPMCNAVYTGIVGDGAWKRDRNGEVPIHVRPSPSRGMIALGSRTYVDDPVLPTLLNALNVTKLIHIGSALKFCRIAEGSADLYVRPGHTMEWDTAAPQAIVEAAGGNVCTLNGEELRYGKPGWRNPGFFCAGLLSHNRAQFEHPAAPETGVHPLPIG